MINNKEIYKMQRDIEDLKNKPSSSLSNDLGGLKFSDAGMTSASINKIKQAFKELNPGYNAWKNILVIRNRFGIIGMCGWYNTEHPNGKFLASTHYTSDGQIGSDHLWTFVNPGWYHFLNIRFDENFNKVSHWNGGYFGNNYESYYNQGLFPTGKDEIEVLYCDSAIQAHKLPNHSDNDILHGQLLTGDNVISDGNDLQMKRSSSDMISKFKGKDGQLIVNNDTKRIHILDGVTDGGTIIPNMDDISSGGSASIDDSKVSPDKCWSSSKVHDIENLSESIPPDESIRSNNLLIYNAGRFSYINSEESLTMYNFNMKAFSSSIKEEENALYVVVTNKSKLLIDKTNYESFFSKYINATIKVNGEDAWKYPASQNTSSGFNHSKALVMYSENHTTKDNSSYLTHGGGQIYFDYRGKDGKIKSVSHNVSVNETVNAGGIKLPKATLMNGITSTQLTFGYYHISSTIKDTFRVYEVSPELIYKIKLPVSFLRVAESDICDEIIDGILYKRVNDDGTPMQVEKRYKLKIPKIFIPSGETAISVFEAGVDEPNFNAKWACATFNIDNDCFKSKEAMSYPKGNIAYNIERLDSRIDSVDISNIYTKQEIDNKIKTIGAVSKPIILAPANNSKLSGYYNKSTAINTILEHIRTNSRTVGRYSWMMEHTIVFKLTNGDYYAVMPDEDTANRGHVTQTKPGSALLIGYTGDKVKIVPTGWWGWDAWTFDSNGNYKSHVYDKGCEGSPNLINYGYDIAYSPFHNITYHDNYPNQTKGTHCTTGKFIDIDIMFPKGGELDKIVINGSDVIISTDNTKHIIETNDNIRKIVSVRPGDNYGELELLANLDGTVSDILNISFTNTDADSDGCVTVSSKISNGPRGQVRVNLEDLRVSVETGLGNVQLAKKSEVDELFQSVSDGKNSLEATITDRGGEVSKVGQTATFNELKAGIEGIPTNDPDHICREDGKDYLLDVIVSKIPSLDGVLTIESSLNEFARYVQQIGPMYLTFKNHTSTNRIVNLNIEPISPQMKAWDYTVNTIKRDESFNQINVHYDKVAIDNIVEIQDITLKGATAKINI